MRWGNASEATEATEDTEAEAYSASFARNVAAKNIVGKRNSERYIFQRYSIFVMDISWSADAGSVAYSTNSLMICWSVRSRKNHAWAPTSGVLQ